MGLRNILIKSDCIIKINKNKKNDVIIKISYTSIIHYLIYDIIN